MHILSDSEIEKQYLMADAIRDTQDLFPKLEQGQILVEHRTVMELPDTHNAMLYMPCLDLKEKLGTNKIISIFPDNPKLNLPTTQGKILITELETGQHKALIDASYLTRLRTGALSGIATHYLSRKDSRVLGVIGTGGMAFEQVLGILEVRNIEQIYLYNRTNEKAKIFKEKLIKFGINAKINVVKDVQEVVKQSDIINCATRSNESVFDAIDLKQGAHINGVGSYQPSMREIDIKAIEQSSKIVFDDINGAKTEAGEFIQAEKDGHFSFDHAYSDLQQLALGNIDGRTDEHEITIFKSVGAAHFDLAVGVGVFKKLLS